MEEAVSKVGNSSFSVLQRVNPSVPIFYTLLGTNGFTRWTTNLGELL
jgi:hypothetical protein